MPRPTPQKLAAEAKAEQRHQAQISSAAERLQALEEALWALPSGSRSTEEILLRQIQNLIDSDDETLEAAGRRYMHLLSHNLERKALGSL